LGDGTANSWIGVAAVAGRAAAKMQKENKERRIKYLIKINCSLSLKD